MTTRTTRHPWRILSGIFFAAAVPLAQAGLTDIYNFTDGVDGASPQSGLCLGANGILYGTAVNGGTNGFGAVFSVTTAGGFTPLYSFTGNADGGAPWAGLIQLSNGNFYGTTLEGGDGYGTIFEITPGGALTTLYTFTGGNDGASPQGNLVLASDGNLYGTASAGGSSGAGTLFRVTPAGGFTALYSFTGGADGATPLAGLAPAANGLLYGSTSAGGASTNGTLFKIDTSGNFTLLHTFSGADGSAPQVALAVGTDGNYYGVAAAGGAANNGALFQLTPAGQFKTLYSFSSDKGTGTNSDGIAPVALIAASNGNLYGVASAGGPNGAGTIFSSTLAGALTPLYSFGAISSDSYTNSDGANPTGIMQGSDGNFYGTTASGGPQALGSLFAFNGSAPFQFLTVGGIRYSGGQAVLTLSGASAQGSVVVDASTNLSEWTPILTNPASTGQIQVTDTAAQSFPHRFYRARQTSP